MAKVDTDLVEYVLKKNKIDTRVIKSILEALAEEQKAVQEEKSPVVKKQYVPIISDPDGILEDKEFTGWVVQIPEEESPYTALEKLIASAYEYNTSKKGRRMPVGTIGEVCEAVPAKILKEQNVWVKTKEPVFILRTDNSVPLEKTTKKNNRGE
jgi:hypothetical protein